MTRQCARCGRQLAAALRPGRTPTFCSGACRTAAHRARALPAALTSRAAWCRAAGKRPITTTGRPASSTDPATWATYRAVHASSAGDGLGIMLGAGLACYDLDYALEDGEPTAAARELLAGIGEPIVWAEVSVSGAGLHIFVTAPPGRGYRRPGIEYYSAARFIRVSGARFDPAKLHR